MSNTANKNLLSSTGIAILASVGIHGLLWAVLPGLTLDSQADKSPSQRTIGLVDLSPQEQNRLPQVSNPVDNTLPPFASQLTDLPPLPPAPPYQTSVMPPLQLPPGSAPIYNQIPNQTPPLQTFQVLLPPPPNTSFPPIPYENLPNYPNNLPLPSAPPAPPFVLPANNGLPDTPLTADRTLPANDEIATATPSPAPTSNSNIPSPSPTVEGNKLPERGKQELLAMRDSMRNNFPSRAATPAPTTTRALSRQEIAAALRRQDRLPPTTTRALSRQEIATALRGNRNPSSELSEDTKTALDNLDKFKRQQALVQAQNPDVVTKPPIRRKLTTCDRAIDGDVAVVNVVVNPEGKRLSEPNLITKTGKPDIAQAQNYVRNYEFAKTDKTTNYNFRLEFDYSTNKCAQAKPTRSSPTPTPTPPSPEPTSTPTPSLDTPPSPSPEPTTTPQSAPSPIDPKKPSF
ncbi:hypothetical protein [Synechocystis sp. PCC 7509]|uniref:hypothetical protein n=1 Tax=Synechocystis sp. PCC 7509 TaxID=927677 RepID=UPI0002AC6739|nr:hypothetical protein [Synechocystis sp. PCC 7509]